jgi:hypothetical protein
MPFTLSHPAVTVPFAKYGLPLSALVIGSMTPDFVSFIPLAVDRQFTHSWPGVFLYCIPVGLAALWLFHRVLKFPLLSLLPLRHQEKLTPVALHFRFGPISQLLLIVCCLIFGAATHILWDLLTHAGPWVDQNLPILYVPLVQTPYGELVLFKLLQHGSNIIGLFLLAKWYLAWFKQASTELAPLRGAVPLSAQIPRANRSIFVSSVAVATWLATGIYTCQRLFSLAEEISLQQYFRATVVNAIVTTVGELLLFSLFWHGKAALARKSSCRRDQQ